MPPPTTPLETLRLRTLIVEDLPHDAELMILRLEEEGLNLDWRCVQTEPDYLSALGPDTDLILADWHLPRFSGLRALELMRERELDIPFIIVSGGIGEEAAIEALHLGASDYVLKDRPARLGAAVRRALEEKRLHDERRRNEVSLRQAACVFDSTAEGICLTDQNARIVAVNPAFTAITGYSEAEALGQNPRILKSGHHDETFYRDMWSTLLSSGQWRGELWCRRKNGEIYPEWLNISTVRNAENQITHYAGVFSDMSPIREAEKKLEFLAHYDSLTRLPNPVLLRDRLQHGLERAQREQRPLAVLFLDVDRFKNINDSLGHSVGDQLLQALAQRLYREIRGGDTLARMSGDEFVLLLESNGETRQAAIVAQKLLELVAAPLTVAGHEMVVTASIGISLYPTDGEDADTLLKHADRAMFEAKSRGRNSFRFFEPSLSAGMLDRMLMENALRRAVAREELELYYQPQVDLQDGSLVGVETLVRWRHGDAGLVPPAQFIPLAEEMGIVGDIGSWVLEEACHQIHRWDASGFHVPRVAINLSVQQIEYESLLKRVQSALCADSLAALRLELEVTESVIMREPDHSAAVLKKLMELGLQLAVDDFGTGYSSLAYLKQLSLHRLKIDQSFVRDIGRDPHCEAIIRAVIALAQGLGLETVAEGVERKQQADFLRAEGCDIGQGYLYGKPMPAEELARQWRH